MNQERSAFTGSDSNVHYNEPKGRVFDRAQSELNDVVIIGRDNKGEPRIWSNVDQTKTEALVREAAPSLLEPAE